MIRRRPKAQDSGALTYFECLDLSDESKKPRRKAQYAAYASPRHQDDRFVAVHLGARVEFLLRTDSAAAPPHAEVECRPVNSLGATGETIVARFRFNETGVVTESSVPELVEVRLDQKAGAWSIVAAVMWDALQAQP